MRTEQLTDVQLREFSYVEGQGNTISDGGGLQLRVKKTGAKLWQYRYRFAREDQLTGTTKKLENTLSFGSYPDIPLTTQVLGGRVVTGARELALRACALLEAGINPSTRRDTFRDVCATQSSFKAVALAWFDTKRTEVTLTSINMSLSRLDKYVFPYIGVRSIASITSNDILTLLRAVEKNGIQETARRVLNLCKKVMQFAIDSGLRTGENPVHCLKSVILSPLQKSAAALLDPNEIAGLLRASSVYRGEASTRIALQFGLLTFARPNQLRKAQWCEIHNLHDIDHAEFRIPEEKNDGVELAIPLSRQAVALLQELKPLTGKSTYLFPAPRSAARPMSSNTVNGALRRMGFVKEELTGNGFRVMARMVCQDVLNVKPEVINVQLGHRKSGVVAPSYTKERQVMMQAWADYLGRISAT